MTTTARPFFVYGTLRPGHGNYARLLSGRTIRETPATAPGIALYGTGIPFAVPTPGTTTIGALIHVDPTRYQSALAALDSLEGFYPEHPEDSLYIRATRRVLVGDTAITAWIYLAGSPDQAAIREAVPGNDWELLHPITTEGR